MKHKDKIRNEIVAAVEMLDELRASVEGMESLTGTEVSVLHAAIESIHQKFKLKDQVASVESLIVGKDRIIGTIDKMTTELESRVDKINFL